MHHVANSNSSPYSFTVLDKTIKIKFCSRPSRWLHSCLDSNTWDSKVTRIKTVYTVWRISGAGCQYYHAFIQYTFSKLMKPCSWHRSILLQGHPGTKRGKHALHNIDTQSCQCHIWTAKHQCFRNTLPSDANEKSNHFSCTSVNDSSRLRATSHRNLDPRSELFVAIVLHTPSITPTPVGNTYASSTVNARLEGHIKWPNYGFVRSWPKMFAPPLFAKLVSKISIFFFPAYLSSHSLSTVQSAASARALESVLQLIFCACLCPTPVFLVCRHINFSAFEPQQIFTARGVSGDFLVPGLQHP